MAAWLLTSVLVHLVHRQPKGGAILREADDHGSRVSIVLLLHHCSVKQVWHLRQARHQSLSGTSGFSAAFVGAEDVLENGCCGRATSDRQGAG